MSTISSLSVQRQHKVDVAYIKMAQVWAELSHATRKKVGALIVKNNTIIADGFNGTPSGFENECEEAVMNDDPTFKPNTNFKLDMFNVVLGIIAQLCLTLLPIYLVLWMKLPLLIIIVILIIIIFLLKKTWWNKLED